ncbi:hypothetical protein BTS2_3338 [Bacillus sp. TS-2]|nr:hypothetical protein BTS2_3338 [Bacillus sp. TS-2]
MAKNRKKRKDDISRFVCFLILGSIAYEYYITGKVFFSIRGMAIILLAVPFFYLLKKQQYKKRMIASGINDIDQMDGFQFESYLVELFKARGYKVIKTPNRGDFGADLLLKKDGLKIAVQAKRYKKNVTIKAVQEIQSALLYYQADEAWCITNSDYTKSTYELANKTGVKLINREKLIKYILEAQGVDQPKPGQTLANVKAKNISCDCGAAMIVKKNRINQNRFYGCSDYPKCRNTRALM